MHQSRGNALVIRPIVISAPFGNWIQPEGCTATVGTYTLKYRAGLLKRIFLALTKVKSVGGGFINSMGLPNPGIKTVRDVENNILSIHGFDTQEWFTLIWTANGLFPSAIELNISCPNAPAMSMKDIDNLILALKRVQLVVPVIVKLPPIHWLELARPFWHAGIRHFHACNTIWTPKGGISGKPLKQYSIWAVQELRQFFPEATIIGGGGVTKWSDVKDYLKAGANHIAVGGLLFNPFCWNRPKKWSSELKSMEELL